MARVARGEKIILPFGVRRSAEKPQPSIINHATQRFKHQAERTETVGVKGGGDPRQFRDGEKFLQIHRLTALDALGEVAENGAGGHAAFAGDLLNGEAAVKTAQRRSRGIAEAAARWRRRGGRGERFIRKNLARVRLQMRGDFAEENLAELAQLLFADAADAGEFTFAGGIIPRHLPERHVGKNNVSGNVAFVRQPLAKLAQFVEQSLVAGNFTDAMFLPVRRGDGFGERDCPSLFERGAAFVRQFQHAEFVRGLPEKTEPHQFAANRGPFGTAVFLADAEGRKLRVIPFADFFRVRAGEDLDNVVQPDAKTVFLTNSIDAGKKFLRGQRAVEGGARRKAVVARAAVCSGIGILPVSFGLFLRTHRQDACATKLFAKIREQFLSPAASAFGVVDHLLQLFAGDLLFLRAGLFVNEHGLLHHVAGAEEQDAFARQAVAARAAGFLIIALDVFRQIVVDDKTDVRLVDAHAEGDGRANHAHVVAQKKFLMLAALLRRQPGVIWFRLHAVF